MEGTLMSFAEKTSGQVISELAAKTPVPGGGGASALVGAVGTALGLSLIHI